MGTNEDPPGKERARLYRDVWGAEAEPPATARQPSPPRSLREPPSAADPGGHPPADREWESGGRLRALELEVRELRSAVQSLQDSIQGSIGALRSSIRQLTAAMNGTQASADGADSEREPFAASAVESAPTEPGPSAETP